MINNYILESAKVVNSLRNQATKIKKISSLIFNCSKKNKVLVAGNGGSSADAEHFVGELICTYSKRNRKPISAISLTQPVSAMTAWSNDFDYNSFIQRQVEANGKKGDILFLLSTGGGSLRDKTSINLINAAYEAKKRKMKIISLIGKSGGFLKKFSDEYVLIKSQKTSFIQEAHMVILHLICEILEKKL